MPAFTQSFLIALRGTAHDAGNQKVATSPANGGATLEIMAVDEKFVTMRGGQGGLSGFTVNATAHALLSDPLSVAKLDGTAFQIGAQSYSGVIDNATGELQISEAGQ